MATRIGINGFGRIGRQILKAIHDYHLDTLEVVAFNDLGDLETMAHLLKYDSNYGRFPGEIDVSGDGLQVNDSTIKALSERDPSKLPWADLGVDIVIESTGIFRQRDQAAQHLHAGAKKVVISAPSSDPDLTVVMGVNDDTYNPDQHHVISNASCTTNCLAPAAKVVNDNFGIVKGIMTTIHSYTNGQRILDLPHKDPRRARAAALNIIPTSTGAARAVSRVIPDLEGKFDGMALRVPTPTVSIVDLVVELEKDATTDDLLTVFRAAADGPMQGILGCSDEPLVSMDYKGDSRSSIVDAEFTQVIGSNMAKIIAWYDNEWAYAVRVTDLSAKIAKTL